MIEQSTQHSEIEQRRKERKPIKRQNRRNKITRHCCLQCGEPKHYICLEHNTFIRRKNRIEGIYKRIRYYSRKIYYSLAVKIGLA